MELKRETKSRESQTLLQGQRSAGRANPPHLPAHPLHQLRQVLGNRALGQFIQAKLRASQPGDEYEQEADRVADQVMRMTSLPVSENEPQLSRDSLLLQRKCSCGESTAGGSCTDCANTEEVALHRSATGPTTMSTVPGILHDVLRSPGEPLGPQVRSFMEPRFGHDFSQVRIHAGERAAQSAQRVNAVAYSVGQDVVFGAGRYQPETFEGKKLLAHELTHVVQQGRGQPTAKQLQTSPLTISRLNDPSRLSRQMETDEDGEKVATEGGQQPKDMDESQAAQVGTETLHAVGYDEIIRLALEAGFLADGPTGEGGAGTTEAVQRQASVPDGVIYRQGAEAAATFGGVFSRYAVAAGITSQLDSPVPGPADVVALGILVVGLVAAGYTVLSRPAARVCPPCPPNPPPEIDRVPPSAPHFPCTGDHWHFRVYNQNPLTCQCFLSGRQFGGCCGVPGAPC